MSDLYEGREQSLVKHQILRKYLERFAHKIGMTWPSITYVDGFSGPWESRTSEYTDTSFGIAIGELRRAQETCASRNKRVRIRCFFTERDSEAHKKLSAFAQQVTDMTVRTRQSTLGVAVPEIVEFIKEGGRSFPFIFLDPKGWTGLELDLIAPLLRLQPGEVLVNFMTEFIRRFIDAPDPTTRKSFERMFGKFHPDIEGLQGLKSDDRDDALVDAYANLLAETGGFKFVCKAVVLRPEVDRAHYHLIYATRHPAGVEVFKEAERTGMAVQQVKRAEVKKRRDEEKHGPTLFSVPDEPVYFNELRSRYLKRAHERVLTVLRSAPRVPFDQIWSAAMTEPIVQLTDLDEWIARWRERGQIAVEGLQPNRRVLKRNQGILISREFSATLDSLL